MRPNRLGCSLILLLLMGMVASADDGNRLTYLDEFCDPYYVGRQAARLVTPQWIGEPGVEAVLVLSIDDLRDPPPYERFLRPILERLKKIDGRAPVSIMVNRCDPDDPRLQRWLEEGLSLEAHTLDHPCPCLQGSDFEKAKATYDGSVDLMAAIPNGRTVAYRMPCCDSMNSVSPRFFTEIFNRTTPQGNFLAMNSSVFMQFTPDDPALPRPIVIDPDGRQRFNKYVPRDRNFLNYVEDYPYPYVIARLCWEIPGTVPDDWLGHNLHGSYHPNTVADMKAAIDATVIKRGVFTLVHHPGGWVHNDQVIDLIDHAVGKYGRKVKFLNFREIYDKLMANLLDGHPLRAANGQDNGVRLLDVNHDGYMDVVIANEKVRQTRIWLPQTGRWTTTDFPVRIVTLDEQGNRRDAGVRFGVLRESGRAGLLVRNEKTAGVWHFDGQRWIHDPEGLAGLDADGPLFTSRDGRDQGVRLRDLDGDGRCELIAGNPARQAVFGWSADRRRWQRLPFGLPAGTSVVDARGGDAGLRFVDVDEDGRADVVFSNARRWSLDLFTSMTDGWSRRILSGEGTIDRDVPMIVRADGTNNGAWFKYRHMVVQNEETGARLPNHVECRSFTALLDGDIEPPARSPEGSLRSMIPRPGFTVELMAAEPLVMDPIDIAWGPDGKAWVVEMADYPLGMDAERHIGPPSPIGRPGGRVRYLEDTNGDGRYDRSTLFLEPVAFPSGIMPWRKGVIVTAAPETFYAEDTDGDGRADLHRTLYHGFREGNQQHRVNHPRWGLDNWVHLANGDSGGAIRSTRTGQVLNISGRDLRVRPDEGLMDAQTGQTQYGRNRDDWGNWFGCNNNNPGWHYAVADHYIRRNPHVAAPPGKVDLTGARDVYPAGRVITHCFIHQPTPPEGQPGRWTSVAGVMVYRDDLFGPEYTGNVFVEDSVYSVVHRMILSREGVLLRGRRALDEQHAEFLATADPYFRPASMRTGPDGALWVTDMYRFVIEHPEWIDPGLAAKLELRRHHDRGRIYRIYPVDKRPRPIPRLDRLDTAGLVAALDSPSGWQRDLAQQMLFWRADKGAMGPLEKMAGNRRPLARLHALCTLEGLGALRAEILLPALADEHPGVRRHAVRLSEPLAASSPAIGTALLKLVDDPDAQVRMQLAYSLGEWADPRAGRALAQIALRDADDPYLTAAVMSSAVPHVKPMLAELRSGGEASSARTTLIGQLEKLAREIQARPELTADYGSAQAGAEPRSPVEPDRQRVEKLLGRAATVDQVERVLHQRRPVLDMFGDPERGKKMFVEATCSTCHRFEGLGDQIGPDLRTLTDRSPQNLLVSVTDPNRAVLDRFVQYIAVTGEGLTYPGMLLEETGNSITLVNTEGKRGVILRKDLDELVFTGRSHMPEGLEAKMDLHQMADLFAFVGIRLVPAAPPPAPGSFRNVPEKIRPDKDGVLVLPATQAKVHGPGIAFEPKYGNLGLWYRPEGYGSWTIEVPRGGSYEVWLDWACQDATAGNRFQVQVADQSLAGQVCGTGTWDNYQLEKFGQIQLAAGEQRLVFRAAGPIRGALIDLRTVKLVPVK